MQACHGLELAASDLVYCTYQAAGTDTTHVMRSHTATDCIIPGFRWFQVAGQFDRPGTPVSSFSDAKSHLLM